MSDESERQTIKKWRRSRWLTQAELAEKVGVTHWTISNWEKGIKPPSLRNMRRLAEALGITPEQIELVKGQERPAA